MSTAPLRMLAIAPIRIYQRLVSPFLPANTCKYHPSCSEYAALAIRKHGILRGLRMAGWRLLRCNPWSHGGVDYP
ncbi:MAG TPA: membrane protein insertion efficiency factor YidD [Gaiellaceae bacterium]|jgi:putative membrane protein insertion efficiency factor|nr:membrane protein insertion efficiency factor YidD [Gaiellaceae bacterium]